MEVQKMVQSNSIQFKKMYNDLIIECISRRKRAKFSQEYMAEWLGVDRRKIIELEKGEGGVGLLLNYADRLDIETFFNFKAH